MAKKPEKKPLAAPKAAESRRDNAYTVRYNDAEDAAVSRAATNKSLEVGSWIRMVSVEAADAQRTWRPPANHFEQLKFMLQESKEPFDIEADDESGTMTILLPGIIGGVRFVFSGSGWLKGVNVR